MNNVEIIKGIEMTIAGLTAIKTALGATPVSVEAPVEKTVEQVMNATVVEEKKEAVASGDVSVESLNSMKYNEFKKYAASLGVDCKGTRVEIMERVLAVLNNAPATEETEEVEETPVVEEEQETKSDRPAKSKKFAKAEVDEPTRDKFDEQAEEVAKDTDVEDIIEALADVDIKATKKNAVAKLAEALRNGLIELDDEDEEEESEPVEDEADEEEDDAEIVESDDEDENDEEEDFTADSYFSEYDSNGFNNPESMTEERAEAIQTKMQKILDAVDDESLTVEDIQSYLEDHATEDEIDLLGEEPEDEECLKLYMELVKRTIDNDGDEHEPSDPYEVGEHDLCCGHELSYSKKTKKYICSICGTEYEAE